MLKQEKVLNVQKCKMGLENMMQKFGFEKAEYEKHPEAIANKYALHCMRIAMVLLCFIWFMNILNVFMVDAKTIATAATMDLIIYAIGVVFFGFVDLRERWVKYVVVLWAVAMMTILTTYLTFHAYLVCVLPIIFCSMYSSKKITWWGYFLTVIGITITVYVGFNHGVCDANMALLSGKPLAQYIGPDGKFILTEINNKAWTLPLFFVVPRSLICLAMTLTCSTVSKIVRNNIKYAQDLEKLAEIDEMTGVFNRNKYLSMTSEGYKQEDKIAVIFWDINYLKRVNDTLGHEQGDVLIKAIAGAIRKVANQFDQAYRIGGDEFVMIMRGGDKETVEKKIKEWEEEIAKIDNIGNVPVSAACGYAYGKGEDLESIIHDADQMMYENKRKFHEVDKE